MSYMPTNSEFVDGSVLYAAGAKSSEFLNGVAINYVAPNQYVNGAAVLEPDEASKRVLAAAAKAETKPKRKVEAKAGQPAASAQLQARGAHMYNAMLRRSLGREPNAYRLLQSMANAIAPSPAPASRASRVSLRAENTRVAPAPVKSATSLPQMIIVSVGNLVNDPRRQMEQHPQRPEPQNSFSRRHRHLTNTMACAL
jgi:hypothetical protein